MAKAKQMHDYDIMSAVWYEVHKLWFTLCSMFAGESGGPELEKPWSRHIHRVDAAPVQSEALKKELSEWGAKIRKAKLAHAAGVK